MIKINEYEVRKNLTRFFKSVEYAPEDVRQAIAEIALDVLLPKDDSEVLSNEDVFPGVLFSGIKGNKKINEWPGTDAVVLRRLSDRINLYFSPSIIKQLNHESRVFIETGFNEVTQELFFMQTFDSRGSTLQRNLKNSYVRLPKIISAKFDKYHVTYDDFIVTERRNKPWKHFVFNFTK